MDKRKLYVIFTIIIVALLPSAVFASVIIDQSYSVSTTTPVNPIHMTQGPNYAIAHSLGFTTLTNGTSPTGNTITVGYVGNDTCVELLNVLEIYNDSKATAAPTYISLSVSGTADIAIYYSSTLATQTFPTTFPVSTTNLGTELTTTATDIHITTASPAPVEYLSVLITGSVSSSSAITLTMSYEIG